MMVHSTLYYRLCTSIITDAAFDRWAYELCDLQRDYPEEAAAAPYAAEFSGWDATTGFDLPHSDWALRKAAELLRYHNENKE